MKKKAIYPLSLFRIACVVVVIALWPACNAGIRKIDTGPETADDKLPVDQLIIWRKPDSTESQVNAWITKLENAGRSKVKVQRRLCGSCDNSLMLISGPGVENFIQTHPADGNVSSGTGSPTTGEDGPLFYARNYRVIRREPVVNVRPGPRHPPVTPAPGEVVKIAVFDTGVDPEELVNYSFHASSRSCLKGGEAGWNFIMNNNDVHDDAAIKHGSVVTRLITDEASTFQKSRVEILPVKTHDANGVSDLFKILCGFAYAKEMGVQIINASFGFYVPRRKLSPPDDPADPNVLLLRKFVEHYLTKNNILLVTAAGNTDHVNLRQTFKDHGWPYRPNDPRDLDQVAFFPASLARSERFPNVIAATTVGIMKGKVTVSPQQNYSRHVVDIGVMADAVSGEHFVFNNPLLDNRETVEGSSFAAPVVTGILGLNYHKIKSVISRKNYSKEDIWKELGPPFIRNNQNLSGQIRDGRVMMRIK